MRKLIPYPLRSVKFSLDLNPFGFWLVPRFRYCNKLTELAKQQGERIWWFRWMWFQVSYSRWV